MRTTKNIFAIAIPGEKNKDSVIADGASIIEIIEEMDYEEEVQAIRKEEEISLDSEWFFSPFQEAQLDCNTILLKKSDSFAKVGMFRREGTVETDFFEVLSLNVEGKKIVGQKIKCSLKEDKTIWKTGKKTLAILDYHYPNESGEQFMVSGFGAQRNTEDSFEYWTNYRKPQYVAFSLPIVETMWRESERMIISGCLSMTGIAMLKQNDFYRSSLKIESFPFSEELTVIMTAGLPCPPSWREQYNFV